MRLDQDQLLDLYTSSVEGVQFNHIAPQLLCLRTDGSSDIAVLTGEADLDTDLLTISLDVILDQGTGPLDQIVLSSLGGVTMTDDPEVEHDAIVIASCTAESAWVMCAPFDLHEDGAVEWIAPRQLVRHRLGRCDDFPLKVLSAPFVAQIASQQ